MYGKNWSFPVFARRAVRRVPDDAVRVAAAVAVGRRRRAVVVDPRRADPGRAAVRRLVEEDVVVRVADRAVAVVVEHDVDVVGERAAALVGHDRVEDRVGAEARVRQDGAGRALAAGDAVGAAVDAARLVHVVERVDAERAGERLAAVVGRDDEVLVLVGRVAVDEADPELAGRRVDRRLGALAVVAPVVRAAAGRAERGRAVDQVRRRPRARLVVGVARGRSAPSPVAENSE